MEPGQAPPTQPDQRSGVGRLTSSITDARTRCSVRAERLGIGTSDRSRHASYPTHDRGPDCSGPRCTAGALLWPDRSDTLLITRSPPAYRVPRGGTRRMSHRSASTACGHHRSGVGDLPRRRHRAVRSEGLDLRTDRCSDVRPCAGRTSASPLA